MPLAPSHDLSPARWMAAGSSSAQQSSTNYPQVNRKYRGGLHFLISQRCQFAWNVAETNSMREPRENIWREEKVVRTKPKKSGPGAVLIDRIYEIYAQMPIQWMPTNSKRSRGGHDELKFVVLNKTSKHPIIRHCHHSLLAMLNNVLTT